MARERFRATAHLDPEEHERMLFDRVCDAVGATAAYVAHDVMPDIRSKLIDEGWFGRPSHPGHAQSHAAGAPWSTPGTIIIDGEIMREHAVASPTPSPDHDIDR